MAEGLVVGRVLGIPIRVHESWLLIFFLVTWSLSAGLYPESYPGWSTPVYWAAGAATALLLFACVLAHELSHALVARSRGIETRAITLFLFGGVATMDADSKGAADELLIAGVGPVTSLAIGWATWTLGAALEPSSPVLGAILGHLGPANVMLAVFNLLPGFPLDGGRVLRAAVWATTGSERKATNVASYGGQVVAFGLIAWGVTRLLDGAVVEGLWISFVGWFLHSAAVSGRRELSVRDTLRGTRVAELMSLDPPEVAPSLSVERFVHEEVLRHGHRAASVVDGHRLVGVVSVTDARKVPPETWTDTPVSAVMSGGRLATTAPTDDLYDALTLMAERDVHQLPVVADGRLVGELTRAAVVQYLALGRRYGADGSASAPEPAGSRPG